MIQLQAIILFYFIEKKKKSNKKGEIEKKEGNPNIKNLFLANNGMEK